MFSKINIFSPVVYFESLLQSEDTDFTDCIGFHRFHFAATALRAVHFDVNAPQPLTIRAICENP